MTSEQPPRDALRRYRPLPSINIPLLREERSAVRSRRLVQVAVAATLTVGALGGVALAYRYASRGDELRKILGDVAEVKDLGLVQHLKKLTVTTEKERVMEVGIEEMTAAWRGTLDW